MKPDPRKWRAPIHAWTALVREVASAVDAYALIAYQWEHDVTKRQMLDEAWLRLADHWGFEIKFNREPLPAQAGPDEKGGG